MTHTRNEILLLAKGLHDIFAIGDPPDECGCAGFSCCDPNCVGWWEFFIRLDETRLIGMILSYFTATGQHLGNMGKVRQVTTDLRNLSNRLAGYYASASEQTIWSLGCKPRESSWWIDALSRLEHIDIVRMCQADCIRNRF